MSNNLLENIISVLVWDRFLWVKILLNSNTLIIITKLIQGSIIASPCNLRWYGLNSITARN